MRPAPVRVEGDSACSRCAYPWCRTRLPGQGRMNLRLQCANLLSASNPEKGSCQSDFGIHVALSTSDYLGEKYAVLGSFQFRVKGVIYLLL
jgi:hypothetical protein